MLIDTDVLIWMTRGHAGAASRLQSIPAWRISAVTYMELAQSARIGALKLLVSANKFVKKAHLASPLL